MLTPAEELGLAGATLDARVRHAVNHVPDSSLAHIARRLIDDARENEIIYERDGNSEAVRIMLRPLLVMPEQVSYLHQVCTRIMGALARVPELFLADSEVRKILPLADDECTWLEATLRSLGASANPTYGRLDAVCDFTSARWQDSLRFMEPNLSGVGGIHFGPLAEMLVMRDVVPTLLSHDPSLAIEPPRDQRDLFLQVLLDHARTVGRKSANICLIEPKYVAEGPPEQSHLVAYYRVHRGITLHHADPRELRLVGDEVYHEDTCIDVAYRDYEIRDLLALEREGGKPLEAIRALFRQNRIVSAIGGDLDHKSCWELFTRDDLAARYFSVADRQLFRRHILWTRVVADRTTDTPHGRTDLPDFIRTHREELVLKPNRSYGGTGVHLGAGVTQADWERLLDAALAKQDHPHESWVVQSAAILPVHLFPVLDERNRRHDEPFYAVMGFAPTDHGLGIICRVSQKQVVNVAQHGGLASVLIGYKPEDLRTSVRAPVRTDQAVDELRAAIRKLRDLDAVIQVLEWDEETYRPPGAEQCRASQLAVLESLRHELLAGDRLGDLIDSVAARANVGALQRAELNRLSRLRRIAIALPEDLVSAYAETRSHCLAAWERARTDDDFAQFAHAFGPLLKLIRERAEALKLGDDLYDALLDAHEPGMRRERLDPLLRATGERLRARVPEWVEQTRRYARAESRVAFDEGEQREFCLGLLADMGFDFARGRVDRSTHPFTMMAGEDDVRLTLRSSPTDPLRAIFATLHEGGHALYDQGLPATLRGTMLADGPSLGLHESQARLWENHVGRSSAFWAHYFPKLDQRFAGALAGLDARAFHRAMNVVVPSMNRVGADEATYNLHVLARYDLEIALLEGALDVADIPGAWEERYVHYLGITPTSAREGCLQDVHWALGDFGYFPTYTIGNLYAAQLIEAYGRSADLSAELARGDLGSLRAWLAEHIYAHGAVLDAEDLIEAATGERLGAEPFFRRLDARIAELAL
jgi:carboxypeptidase Taq